MTQSYQKKITRANPSLIVVMLDGSNSMSEPWGNSGSTLSEGAAFALNRTLRDMAQNACYNAEDGVRDYINLAVFKYGTEADQDNGVEWSLGSLSQPNTGFAPAGDWVPSYIREERVDGGNLPVWIEPHAWGWTPMCKAFGRAAHVVQQHIDAFPDSFPPIVLNITDGIPTDHNDDWAQFERAARAITDQHTTDGNALLFNIHIDASGNEHSISFPDAPVTNYSPYAEHLGRISSVLPANMVARANEKLSLNISEAALGYCLNADLEQLSAFLQIGTFVPVQS